MGLLRAYLHGVPEEAVEKRANLELLVAARNISSGSVLNPEDLRWQPWPDNNSVPGAYEKSQKPNAIHDLSGKVVRAPFLIGEPVTDTKLQE